MSTSSRNTIDMLNGPIYSKIVLFAIPVALSSILQQLFNSADSIFAGRMISSEALAAVGGVTPIISLFVALLTGLAIGANVVIAVHIGHGQREKIKGAIQTIAVVTAVSSVLFTVGGVLAIDPILASVSMPTEAWEEATAYLHVYFLGFTFFLIYNFVSAILRAKGDTWRPLYALAVAAVLNIGLNYAAIAWANAGVAGIAWATVASNAVSAGIVVWLLAKEPDEFRLDLRGTKVVFEDLRKLLYIGLPAGLQGVVFALSNVVVQAAINGFGSAAIAGSSAAMNYEFYTYFFTNAFVQAAVTFVSQNYAAGNVKRCDKVISFCMVAAIAITAVISVACTLSGVLVLGIFTADAAALAFGVIRLWHVELFEFMPCLYEIPAGAMRGMGWSLLPTVIVIVGSCLLRIVYVMFVFPFVASFENLLLIYPFTWVVTAIAMGILFFIARKRSYAKIAAPQASAEPRPL